jgi:ribose transport system ATP-binding protein
VAPRLVARGVTKRYGSQIALREAELVVGAGEIVAVVGENGAGKSTLSKILSGEIQPDAGSIALDGQPLALNSPRDALRIGISYIPQELAYFPNLSVANNLLVGRWPSHRGFTNAKLIEREAASLAERFGIRLDVRRPLADLRLAERQLAEILKALARDVRLLVLDEPTASLTAEESRNLFRVLRGLAASGVGVVFISHRLDEVFDIAQRVVVLRNGTVAGNLPIENATPESLIEHMLGGEIARQELSLATREVRGDPVLRVENLERAGLPMITSASFELHSGEVLGLFGPRGSGADVIADGLGGRITDFNGRLKLDGRERGPFRSPRDARRSGVGYLPPERKREGLILELPVAANLSMLVLARRSRFGWLRRALENRAAEGWVKKLQIRCYSVAQAVSSLSGGNQQKVLVGSRLEAGPKVLVLNEPTRGVDVGARAELHRYLRTVAEAGTAVLWVTSDVEEAVLLSDRLLVMRDGDIVGELAGATKTQTRALALATEAA